MSRRPLIRIAVITAASCLISASALLVGVAAFAPAAAQEVAPPSIIYRLDKQSSYQTGCFDPCLCPLLVETATRGTMNLTAAGSDGLFAVYKVTDVNWTVSLGDPELRVTGSGTYRIGGDFALQEQLELDLQLGDQPTQHFDSGLVLAGDFPSIAVAISINGLYCYDTVFVVHASPVPREQVHPYRLRGESTFQRGCVGLCDCLSGEEQPISGTFSLVDLEHNSLFSEYAVVKVRWQVDPGGSTSGESLPLRGYGNYRIGGEFAVQQRLILDLSVGSDPVSRFDSGLVVPGAKFPRIAAQITSGDPRCFLTVIDLLAQPQRHRRR
jgi:hypothetical protein